MILITLRVRTSNSALVLLALVWRFIASGCAMLDKAVTEYNLIFSVGTGYVLL